jgi:hypothetical protein
MPSAAREFLGTSSRGIRVERFHFLVYLLWRPDIVSSGFFT